MPIVQRRAKLCNLMPLTDYSLYLQKGAATELVFTAMKKKACANQSLSLLFVFHFKLRALNRCSKSDFSSNWRGVTFILEQLKWVLLYKLLSG